MRAILLTLASIVIPSLAAPAQVSIPTFCHDNQNRTAGSFFYVIATRPQNLDRARVLVSKSLYARCRDALGRTPRNLWDGKGFTVFHEGELHATYEGSKGWMAALHAATIRGSGKHDRFLKYAEHFPGDAKTCGEAIRAALDFAKKNANEFVRQKRAAVDVTEFVVLTDGISLSTDTKAAIKESGFKVRVLDVRDRRLGR